MKNIKSFLFLAFSLALPLGAYVDVVPTLIQAKPSLSDPYYPYVLRPAFDSAQAKEIYGPDLARIKQFATPDLSFVPWTLQSPSDDKNALFSLGDVVVDKVVDPQTHKRYIRLYHATTSDLTNVFKAGASSIRFDVAASAALGMGFYVAANPNEAKYYGCQRLGERKFTLQNPNELKTILLVLEVLDDPKILGHFAEPDTSFSNAQGQSLDPKVYFLRNTRQPNQFVLFDNIKQIEGGMRVVKIVNLGDGFGKAPDRVDGDGRSVKQPINKAEEYGYTCPY